MTYTIPVMLEERSTPLLEYNPPYENGLEDELFWHLIKYLREDCNLYHQARLVTGTASAYTWVDALITRGDLVVAIEIGLEDDHERRDAAVIEESPISALVRVSNDFVRYRIHDALNRVATQYPALFSSNGRFNLDVLSDDPIPSDDYHAASDEETFVFKLHRDTATVDQE